MTLPKCELYACYYRNPKTRVFDSNQYVYFKDSDVSRRTHKSELSGRESSKHEKSAIFWVFAEISRKAARSFANIEHLKYLSVLLPPCTHTRIDFFTVKFISLKGAKFTAHILTKSAISDSLFF